MSLRRRIYLSMGMLILVSFGIIGASTFWYTQAENEKYHLERLNRKESSIETALNYYLQEFNNDSLTFYTRGLYEEVEELSDIHHLDINIYDLNGQLVTSSDFGFVDKGYIPEILDWKSLEELRIQQNGVVSAQNINGEEYLFALRYLKTDKGPVAILNIPYYRSEQEFREETRVFLIALTQIYGGLMAVGLLIAYFLSNSITKQLKILEDRIRKLTIDGENQMVDWDANDEIGSLVNAYNYKVQELEASVAKIAQSEREGAWREMAKQVAHEIKNPLTPMLLQVQQLERSWKDGREDFSERLTRFKSTMTEQIETLSRIATEFSNFAKLPETQLQVLDLHDIIDSVAEFFKDAEHYKLELKLNAQSTMVEADKNQLMRVFNNLITNAVQALKSDTKGEIDIETYVESNMIVVQISDNGQGIKPEQLNSIFEPNFTTKSGGTGLGLAMVRSIVNNINGHVSVSSELGTGTSFILNLPLHKKT